MTQRPASRASAPNAPARAVALAPLAVALLAAPSPARAQRPDAPDAGAALAAPAEPAAPADAGGRDAAAPTADTIAAGRDALEDGDLARARAILEAAARAGDRAIAAQALFYLGELAERELRFRDALARYRASIAGDPGGRYASRARARVEYLEVRGEGDFAPLVALERVRTSPALASDVAAIAGLARAAQGFPPGRVRAEARLLAAQAYAGRLARPRDAAPVLVELARDPGATPEMRRLAAQLLLQVREQTGELALALEESRALDVEPARVARIRQLVRRRALHKVALGLVALVTLAGVVSAARAARARRGGELLAAWRRPLPLAHIAMLSVGGALLAHTYDSHEMSPFFGFGAGALLVYLAASAWALVGSARPAVRVARAAVCAAAMLAVSFLAMHTFDVGMLEGIGL